MLNYLEHDERISDEYVWIAGFDEAIYDSLFTKGGTKSTRAKFGLENCGQEYVSKDYPPFCKDTVEVASEYFEKGTTDLMLYVRGYQSGSVVLKDLLRGEAYV